MDRLPDLVLPAILTNFLRFGEPLFSDDFHRANAGDLGANWSAAGTPLGGFQISSNKAVGTNTGGNVNIVAVQSAVDVDIEADLELDATSTSKQAGVCCRSTAAEMYATWVQWLSAGLWSFRVGRHAGGGAFTVLGQQTIVQSLDGLPVLIALRCVGTSLRATLNNRFVLAVSDATYTAGTGFGIYSNGVTSKILAFRRTS